ncbi:MAG: hypothetical protein ACJ8FY_11130 [Gemmataceae bacterium]
MYQHVDARLPGQVKNLLSPRRKEYLMLVPDEVRKCVVYLGHKHPRCDEPKIGGTAFCVSIPNPGIGRASCYLVTAKHNLDGIAQLSDQGLADGKVHLRYNKSLSGVDFNTPNVSDWYSHPTEAQSVDVAVLPINEFINMDILFFRLDPKEVADTELIAEKQIGPGDEIFTVGLFSHRPGTERNFPVIRVGNIAGMPEEPIEVNWNGVKRMAAYLIEARSIGGMSGSPVFVNLGPTWETDRREGRFYILGLIHGHWDYPEPDVDYLSLADTDGKKKKKGRVNTGIAIVVPMNKILEVINQPSLAKKRQSFVDEERRKRSQWAVPD